MEHKIAIVMQNGTFRVHSADCADVAREAKRFRDAPWVFEAESRHEINVSCWGDIASDSTESDTPEWHALCDEYARTDTRYLPCVPGDLI